MESEKLWIDREVVGPVSTNSYLLRDGEAGKEVLLIDPGDEPDLFLTFFRDTDTTPTAIFLTHGHYDHIMAVNEICAAYPSCRVHIAADERPLLGDPELNCDFFDGEYRIAPHVFVRDGDSIPVLGRTFRVIATPGHTAGSVCYLCEEEQILFSGDTLFRNGFGRTDLPTGDEGEIFLSLKKLLTTLPGDTAVLPGHGMATTIEREAAVYGDML